MIEGINFYMHNLISESISKLKIAIGTTVASVQTTKIVSNKAIFIFLLIICKEWKLYPKEISSF